MFDVRKLTEDLRLPVGSNWNALPHDLGIAVKYTGVEKAYEISAALQGLLMIVEGLVVVE